MQDSLPCPLRKKNVIFLRWTFYSVLLKCFISLNSSDCHPDRSDHPTIIHPDRTDHPTNVIHPALSPQVGLMKHDLENTARKHFNYKKRCKWLNGHNTTWPLQCRSSFFPIFLFKNRDWIWEKFQSGFYGVTQEKLLFRHCNFLVMHRQESRVQRGMQY